MKLVEVSAEEWRQLAGGCRLDTVYQDPRWLELIEGVYPRLDIFRLVCLDDAGALLWMLPLVELTPLGRWKPMLISVPFGSYGGFLAPRCTDPFSAAGSLEPLRAFFSNRKAFGLEVRDSGPVPGFAYNDQFRRFEVDLTEGVEALWKGVSGNARTAVRKADKIGMEVVFDHPNALAVFCDLNERHAGFHGTPLHHRDWYHRLYRSFAEQTMIVLAVHEEAVVGALYVLFCGDKAVLHAAVSRPEVRRLAVMDKLLWSMLERLVSVGRVRLFDFGRTRPDHGQLFFKRKWNGRETPVYYSYLLEDGASLPRLLPENPKLAPAITAWRYLPRWVQRKLGPSIRVRIPV